MTVMGLGLAVMIIMIGVGVSGERTVGMCVKVRVGGLRVLVKMVVGVLDGGGAGDGSVVGMQSLQSVEASVANGVKLAGGVGVWKLAIAVWVCATPIAVSVHSSGFGDGAITAHSLNVWQSAALKSP